VSVRKPKHTVRSCSRATAMAVARPRPRWGATHRPGRNATEPGKDGSRTDLWRPPRPYLGELSVACDDGSYEASGDVTSQHSIFRELTGVAPKARYLKAYATRRNYIKELPRRRIPPVRPPSIRPDLRHDAGDEARLCYLRCSCDPQSFHCRHQGRDEIDHETGGIDG
jgi:hypothetical protein